MTMKWISRAAVVSLGLAATTFAYALEQDDVMHRRFTAPITVSAAGQPTIGEISGAQGPFAEAVRSQLATLQYVPARREGAAVDHATHLSGTAVLTPLPDGSFDMRVQAVLAPEMTASVAPRYPPGQLRQQKQGSECTFDKNRGAAHRFVPNRKRPPTLRNRGQSYSKETGVRVHF